MKIKIQKINNGHIVYQQKVLTLHLERATPAAILEAAGIIYNFIGRIKGFYAACGVESELSRDVEWLT